MRIPVKLVRDSIPGWMARLLPTSYDPRPLLLPKELSRESFSRAVSSMYIGGAWKTTTGSRHPLADAIIRNCVESNSELSLLDVGVSDGTTAIDLIDRLESRFKRYWITDRFPSVYTFSQGGRMYFSDASGQPILCVEGSRIVYAPESDNIGLLRPLVRSSYERIPPFDPKTWIEIELIQPVLQAMIERDDRLELRQWDVLQSWNGPSVDIVKCANVLNPSYFTPEQLRAAIQNIRNALNESGRLIIVENRATEQVATYSRKGSKLLPEQSLNGGSDIHALVIG